MSAATRHPLIKEQSVEICHEESGEDEFGLHCDNSIAPNCYYHVAGGAEIDRLAEKKRRKRAKGKALQRSIAHGEGS